MGGVHCYYNLLKPICYLECPSPLIDLGPPSGRDWQENISRLKQATSVRRSSLSRRIGGEYTDMGSCLHVCYSVTINGWTYKRGKVMFWWRNLCCMPFRYYLFHCENVTHIYQSHNYWWKLKLSWNFICKSVYFTRFNSCRTMCFCPNIYRLTLRAFYNIYWLSREERTIFIDFYKCLKRFRHFVSFKLFLFKNTMQYKLTCHSSLLTSRFQHGHHDQEL